MSETVGIHFDKGTLVLTGLTEETAPSVPRVQWDRRTNSHRAPAWAYREIVLTMREKGMRFDDHARAFSPHTFELQGEIKPWDYQAAAISAWKENGQQGVVVLPTGAGKTILSVLIIAETRRPTLVHVPTIDLMHQWYEVLTSAFAQPIGLLGGGYNDPQPLTVATYDSALIHVSHKGNRFGLLIFDECHHLPGEQFQLTAIASIAPFRLGLTATPERSDGKESVLYELLGGLCYRAHIDELEGKTLAPYDVETVEVELTEEERMDYDENRALYIDFLKSTGINMSEPNGWKMFLWKASQTKRGREAFAAYLVQKRLSQAASGKLAWVWSLLVRHAGARILIFTQDNDMAYRIGREFLMPVITHQTKVKERKAFLDSFRSGRYRVLVTSKVLNEGVDVPQANVAIIVSGSGSIREHVQRLGRILRASPGKRAILYELVTAETGEHFVNQRRRQHRAYQRSGPLSD